MSISKPHERLAAVAEDVDCGAVSVDALVSEAMAIIGELEAEIERLRDGLGITSTHEVTA